jgi:hypothetical protein
MSPPSEFIFCFCSLLTTKFLPEITLLRERMYKIRHVYFVLRMNQLHISFFECCVAQCFWSVISEIMGISIALDFESMAKWWLRERKDLIL